MRLDFSDIAGGFILADSDLAPKSEWFEPDYWRERGAGQPLGGGRGQAVTAGEDGCWVLRHYHRGGVPGRFVSDRYVWCGMAAARPVRELRLLASLRERGAPVVKPVAARVLRTGLRYRGDVLTERVSDARTLGDCAREIAAADWAHVGEAIARFHVAGGWHADLNAHNILIAPAGVFVLDLDRGRLVTPGAGSQGRNLKRLERSLTKLDLLPGATSGWRALLDACRTRGPG